MQIFKRTGQIFIITILILATLIPVYGLQAEAHPELGDYSELAYAQSWINTVPVYIQDFLEDAGYRIIVSPHPVSNGNNPIYGSCSKDTKEIYTYGYGAAFSVVHEMGHAFDFQTGEASLSREFTLLFLKESRYLRPYLYVSIPNSQEFYAELFATLMENPDTARKLCPLSSAYIEAQIEVIKDIEGKNSQTGESHGKKQGIQFIR